MDKELMKPVAWMCDYIEDGEHEREYNGHNEFSCGRIGVPLYRLPPMPRDVLMAALGDCRAECAKHYLGDADESEINLAAIADHYASKVQPEPTCQHRIADARNPVVASGYLCVDCGALFSAVDHGERKTEPVNQHLLTLLKLNHALAYDLATAELRGATVAAIDAAEAAPPVCQTCKGSGYIGDFLTLAHDCPDCQQPATAQPVAAPDGYALVPEQPTEEMLLAALYAPAVPEGEETDYRAGFRRTYLAMLSAAKKPEGRA